MVLVHKVKFIQISDGSVRLEQELMREGEGSPSPVLERVVEQYYETFAEFFGAYDGRPQELRG